MSEKFFGIFNSSFLPRAIRIAEEGIKSTKLITEDMVIKILSTVIKRKGLNMMDTNITDEFSHGIEHSISCFVLIEVRPSFTSTSYQQRRQEQFPYEKRS